MITCEHWDDAIYERDDHQGPVQPVPVVGEVVVVPQHKPIGHRLHGHLYCEHTREDCVAHTQDMPLCRPEGEYFLNTLCKHVFSDQGGIVGLSTASVMQLAAMNVRMMKSNQS